MNIMLAGEYGFWSLYNTNTIVLAAFLIFVGFLLYKGVHKLVLGLLDKRADEIRNDLDEAKRLREEAQAIYADYERKLKEVEAESEEIVKSAKANAELAAEAAKVKLEEQIERRIAAGKEQIASAEAAVERDIRARAASIAVEAARAVLTEKLSGQASKDTISAAIQEIEARIN